MIEPLKHRILIQRDAPPKETEGGLHIPEEAQKLEVYGTVLAVGKEADNIIKVGDRVFFGYHDGTKIDSVYADGLDNCWIIPDTQIKAIINA